MKNNININRDSNFFSNHTCQTACAFLAANLLFAYNTTHSASPTVGSPTSRTSTVSPSSTSTDPEYCRHKLEELRKLALSILENTSKTSTKELIQKARIALKDENKSPSTSSKRKKTIKKNLDKLKEDLRKLETTNDQQERTAIHKSAYSILEDALKMSTEELVQQARLTLENENNSPSTSSERREKIEKYLQRLTRLKSEITAVNKQKYLDANKLAIDNISDETKITQGKAIGKGGLGTVYEGTAEKTGNSPMDIVIKKSIDERQNDTREEGQVGQQLADTRTYIKTATLLADKQGLEMVVIPKILEDGTLIQERIHGLDGYDAIFNEKDASKSPFANGYVDDPQKAIQRICGLVLGLYGIHQAWYIHHDLKLENIMIEKTEDKEDPFRIRIIDVAGAVTIRSIAYVHSGNAAPELFTPEEKFKKILALPSYDIYCLGTMLPALLFGNKGISNTKISDKGDPNNMYSGFFYNKTTKTSPFIQEYQELEQTQKDKKKAKTAMDEIILEKFQAMNKRMKKGVKKSYPEPVLKRLAQMTADCLSIDPESRPSAEQIFLALYNMGFSDWIKEKKYNIQNNYLTPEAKEIQGKFWWING